MCIRDRPTPLTGVGEQAGREAFPLSSLKRRSHGSGLSVREGARARPPPPRKWERQPRRPPKRGKPHTKLRSPRAALKWPVTRPRRQQRTAWAKLAGGMPVSVMAAPR
eukprot:10083282-Alexandrium_andersonii.AAC.1